MLGHGGSLLAVGLSTVIGDATRRWWHQTGSWAAENERIGGTGLPPRSAEGGGSWVGSQVRSVPNAVPVLRDKRGPMRAYVGLPSQRIELAAAGLCSAGAGWAGVSLRRIAPHFRRLRNSSPARLPSTGAGGIGWRTPVQSHSSTACRRCQRWSGCDYLRLSVAPSDGALHPPIAGVQRPARSTLSRVLVVAGR